MLKKRRIWVDKIFMSEIVLGCDYNGANDKSCQDTVAKILENAGHTVEKLSIGPGYFPDYDWGKKGNPKGKIGVYLIASGVTALADAYDNPSGFKYVYIGIRGDLKQPRLSTMEEFNSSPIRADKHGDCTSKSCPTLAGKTYPQMNEITKSKCLTVFGETCEELGNNIVSAMGGNGDSSQSTGNDDNASSDDVRTCLQNLLKHWDGDVECVFKGKNVYINRVRDPEETYNTALIEGVNVFSDSISVTDYNPNTINHLIVEWTGGTIEFTDEVLIARFGEHAKTMTAVNKVVEYYEDTSSSDDGTGDGSSSSSDSSSSSSTGSDTGTTAGDSTGTTGDSVPEGMVQVGQGMYYNP